MRHPSGSAREHRRLESKERREQERSNACHIQYENESFAHGRIYASVRCSRSPTTDQSSSSFFWWSLAFLTMGRQAVKQQEAVPLLHDGPLFHESQEDVNRSEPLLLLRAALNHNVDDPSASISTRLLSNLYKAGRIKDQLNGLQNFKSLIIQKNRRRSLVFKPGDKDESSMSRGIDDTDWKELEIVYGILLEWSLGYLSPLPLRRTIHSILETIYDIYPSKKSLESTFKDSLSTLLASNESEILWHSSLDSLDALLLLAQSRPIPYLHIMAAPSMSYLCQKAREIVSKLGRAGDAAQTPLQIDPLVITGVKVAAIAKTFLQDDNFSTDMDLSEICTLCWQLISCSQTPADSLPVLGMAYGGSVSFGSDEECLDIVTSLVDQALAKLKPLPRICFFQGLATGIPDSVWISLPGATESDALRLFLDVFAQTARQAIDPEVRLAALKGTRTLVSRSITLMGPSSPIVLCDSQLKVMKQVSDDLLEIVLQAWENPPTKKMSNSLPPTFQAIIDWKELLADKTGTETVSVLSSLVDRLLQQPAYRKGKYKALECMLPKIGAHRLLQSTNNSQVPNTLLSDLLIGIGDSGHNTGAMADLWAKLLQSLFVDIHQNLDTRPTLQGQTKKNDSSLTTEKMTVSKEWLDTWIPSLADALLSVEWKRRKRIASFCLPRVFSMVQERTDASSQCFSALLNHIGALDTVHCNDIPSKDRETHRDRIVWSILEILRYSTVEKSLMSHKNEATKALADSIVSFAPIGLLREGLVHFSSTIRVTSFQAMEGIVQGHYDNPMDCCLCEMKLWKESLVYAGKEDAREYLSIILFRLLSFLDRLSRLEAAEHVAGSETPSIGMLPNLCYFVNDFLIGEIVVRHATYPDSVVAKETFGLALLESLLIYTGRDLNLALQSNILPKTGALYDRKRLAIEEIALETVRSNLLSCDVVGSLLSCLHSSTWEGTKARSFEILATLLLVARERNLPLPWQLSDEGARSFMRKRALDLASSPRQREADTGARMLALLGLSLVQFSGREEYVNDLICILSKRLRELKSALEFVLQPDTDVALGKTVPLVHGIILALRLIVEADAFQIPKDAPLKPLERLATLLCSGMQISLSVVADVRDGEDLEGLGIDLIFPASKTAPTHGKVNPGAIGANGIFSSLSRIDAVEHERRLASQRIVVGSWLLMREACAAIATVITTNGFNPSLDLSNLSGTLLISTLTSLKHTGAAFAAHSALQKIVKSALTRKDSKALPLQWVNRLVREILSTEKIRDSTLRRSTGYALGFLAVMRSEISLRPVPRSICTKIMHKILISTLPERSRLESFLSTVGLESSNKSYWIFSYLDYQEEEYLREPSQNIRCRVHALNVLRMMILDAPLAKEIFPMVGDAIVSAIMGYVDAEWSVRNSAGMVFSAAMLRVVDADKNAANSETTSKNAITLSELYQSYPALCDVLFSVLSACVSGDLKVDGGGSLPPILPILVLLYRVQPLESCDPLVIERMQRFSTSLLECLRYHHLKVRQAAAKALCNLSGGESSNPLSVVRLNDACLSAIRSPTDWNHLHGTILLLKELRLARKLDCKSSEVPPDLSALLALLQVSGAGLAAPPICLLDAILALRTAEDLAEIQYTLSQQCFHLIFWLCKDAKGRMTIPGISELCTTAATAMVEFATKQILGNSQAEAIEAVDDLSCLLECEIVDVRVPAVKAFKKLIYSGLDSLVLLPPEHDGIRTKILKALSIVLTKAISKELANQVQLPLGTAGTHPPSLRRLSRCLLEVEAARRLVDKDRSSQMEVRLWDIGLAILNYQRADADEPAPLVGNALELLASDFHPENAGPFWPLLDQLSSLALPWRLRYSAACAVALLWQDHKGLRPKLRFLVNQLLQDEDPDARYVIAKAVGPEQNASLSVPEKISADFILKHETSLEDGRLFMLKLLQRTEKNVERLHKVVQERDDPDSQRKIFEEEDPNSYHEPALMDQTSLVALWNIISTENSFSDYHVGISRFATEILTILGGRTDADHLCSMIFATLYTVLLVSTASPADITLTNAAKVFLGSVGSRSLHPTLYSVLQLVAERGPEPLTLEKIHDLCFLLPRKLSADQHKTLYPYKSRPR